MAANVQQRKELSVTSSGQGAALHSKCILNQTILCDSHESIKQLHLFLEKNLKHYRKLRDSDNKQTQW